MNRSDPEPNPEEAVAGELADQELRYRAGTESVQVAPHPTPGHDVYGPESAEVETVPDEPATPADVAADPSNPKQRTGERQAAANRDDDPPA